VLAGRDPSIATMNGSLMTGSSRRESSVTMGVVMPVRTGAVGVLEPRYATDRMIPTTTATGLLMTRPATALVAAASNVLLAVPKLAATWGKALVAEAPPPYAAC